MKKLLIFFAFVFFAAGSSFAQCNEMFDYQEGTSWQWTNYDKKGKFMGKSMQKIEELNKLSNGFEVTISVTHSDKNGEQVGPFSMDMACKDGVVYFDMKKFIPNEHLENSDAEDGEELDVAISGENLEMPINMKEGDYLKDASVSMKIGGSSPTALTMTVDIYDRKVVAEETLNTPAGEFNCFVITQSMKTKLLLSFQMESKEWYSPGMGMIKSESYKKGKLMSYSILTQFSK